MGDCDFGEKKDCKKQPEKVYGAFSDDLESSQKCPIKSDNSMYDDAYTQVIPVSAQPVRCEGDQLDFTSSKKCDDPFVDKKNAEKKLILEKKGGKEIDFAPLPTLLPMAETMLDRVDRNADGRMSISEMREAVQNGDLNPKEKYMVESLMKNHDLIDRNRDGLSLDEVKAFDGNVHMFEKELNIARKYSPELSELTRELNLKGKAIDENHDGRFSKEELISFYQNCKREFESNPSAQGKRELSALNYGIANFDRYATGWLGDNKISVRNLENQMFAELDRHIPEEYRQNFLTPAELARMEMYQRRV